MITASLKLAIEAVPAGAWAVGVSGGVDSVALLELLRSRRDLSLHVVHLDHQTRGEASDQDADFVAQLASSWGLPATIARLSELDHRSVGEHANKSARYRAARFTLFRTTAQSHRLRGVILAHHADDQAETVLQRLLRGSGASGLCGMSPEIDIGGLVVLRPLLGVPKAILRESLIERGLAWREDASNSLPNQQRNRARRLLATHPHLTPVLLELADACRAMTNWLRTQSPVLPEAFDVAALQDLPAPIARGGASLAGGSDAIAKRYPTQRYRPTTDYGQRRRVAGATALSGESDGAAASRENQCALRVVACVVAETVAALAAACC